MNIVANDTPGKINLRKAFTMYFQKDMPENVIAMHFGVTRQAVNIALKPFKTLIKNPESLKVYRENRTVVFDALEQEMARLLLDDKKQKKATLGNVGYVLRNLYEINRLEQGKSTQNLNIRSISMHIQGELDRIERELEGLAAQETGRLQDDATVDVDNMDKPLETLRTAI